MFVYMDSPCQGEHTALFVSIEQERKLQLACKLKFALLTSTSP